MTDERKSPRDDKHTMGERYVRGWKAVDLSRVTMQATLTNDDEDHLGQTLSMTMSRMEMD